MHIGPLAVHVQFTEPDAAPPHGIDHVPPMQKLPAPTTQS
jgi:hypothetical protein